MPWNVPVFDATGKIKDARVGGSTLTAAGTAAVIAASASAVASTGGFVTAASTSQADVQTAVNAASDGDTVLIPNGSSTWTSGIITTKQIIIRAENYTPTPAGTEGAGTTTRNVAITNNSSASLFQFQTGNNYHCGVGGIQFVDGTGDGSHITFTGSGSKIGVIFDCYLENRGRLWPVNQMLSFSGRGGLMWNCYCEGTQAISNVGEGSCLIKNSGGIRDWETASTMGSADDGTYNVYMEDCTLLNCGNFPDIDDHGRFVARHCVYDGSWGETHGFTSSWGGRHWEFYDCTFQGTTANRNLANRYFWCRAGSGVFTDCVVNDTVTPGEYGSSDLLQIGDNTSPSGSYLIDRQPGCGHSGSAYVSDPIYIWNNTGSRAYTWAFNSQPGGWNAVVVEDRDIFVNNGAKSGYSKYTYPHPVRSSI